MVSDALNALRTLCLLPLAELYLRFTSPISAARFFRARGARCAPRSAETRLRLRRTIHAIDRRLPGGGNCYRRALIEMALDPQSASETLHFGLVRGGGRKSGHAWLASDTSNRRTYDAEFTI